MSNTEKHVTAAEMAQVGVEDGKGMAKMVLPIFLAFRCDPPPELAVLLFKCAEAAADRFKTAGLTDEECDPYRNGVRRSLAEELDVLLGAHFEFAVELDTLLGNQNDAVASNPPPQG